MTLPLLMALVVVALLVSRTMAGWIARNASRMELLDVPNERSSHVKPTPRGGGLGIATTALMVSGLAWLAIPTDGRLILAVVVGGALVAGVGILDDRRGLPNHVRFVVHVLASLVAVYAIGTPTVLQASGHVAFAMYAVGACLCVAWSINAFNFMDGIDGMAAAHATIALSAIGIVSVLTSADTMALVSFTTAAACVGFLQLNWSPAKVFMGDVGSGFLGYLFGVLLVSSWATEDVSGTLIPVVVAPFAVDATFTLLARIARRERWWRPHRSHVYQLAVRKGFSHARVAGAMSLLTLVGAALAVLAHIAPLPFIALTYAYVVVLCAAWLILHARWSNR